jgi:hypothetical protein
MTVRGLNRTDLDAKNMVDGARIIAVRLDVAW